MRQCVVACLLVCSMLFMDGSRAAEPGTGPTAKSANVVIGYVFCEDNVLAPQALAPEKLTHINYAFAKIADGRMVEGFSHDAENFKVLRGLKKKDPGLKVLVSVGGWTWSGNFSDMALTPVSRQRFIESAVDFVKRYGLDGLDVDWEFPGQEGMHNKNRPQDRENSTALLAGLRLALDKLGITAGRHYLLTMATAADDNWLAHTEMAKAQAFLDFMNLMAYDQFEEESDSVAAHHAPLFVHPHNPKGVSAAAMVDHYAAAGVAINKIVLGVPFYGHMWGDVPDKEHGLYQKGAAPKVRFKTSFKNIRDSLENKNGFVRYWDDASRAAFLYNKEKHLFVSYEDEQSIAEKTAYVRAKGLAGIMFWQYNDDPDGILLEAIDKGLRVKRN